jgi:arylamine N-acetyltransferase
VHDEAQTDGRSHYRIGDTEVDGMHYRTAEKWHAARKEFVPEYIFSTTPRVLPDFAGMNHYQQTDPQSHFVQNLLCSIPVVDGRISMINNRMVFTSNGQRTEQAIADEQHRALLLQAYFGIQHALLVK